ncbi:hypothetical protein TIFTF001_053625, partial [Ficus carica]
MRTTKGERVVVGSVEFNGWSKACFVTYLFAIKTEEEDGVALILSGANDDRRFIWDLYRPAESGWYLKLLIEASSGTVWTSMAMVKKLILMRVFWMSMALSMDFFVGFCERVILVASIRKVGGKIATRFGDEQDDETLANDLCLTSRRGLRSFLGCVGSKRHPWP